MASQIDISQIPTAETRLLSQTFFTAVKKFYENPQNLAGFEDWKKRKELKALNKNKEA
ncbi:MAG: hypothetical protein ACI4V5_00540 [Prevotella sp.]